MSDKISEVYEALKGRRMGVNFDRIGPHQVLTVDLCVEDDVHLLDEIYHAMVDLYMERGEGDWGLSPFAFLIQGVREESTTLSDAEIGDTVKLKGVQPVEVTDGPTYSSPWIEVSGDGYMTRLPPDTPCKILTDTFEDLDFNDKFRTTETGETTLTKVGPEKAAYIDECGDIRAVDINPHTEVEDV